VWAGNGGTQPGAGNGTCGSGTLTNSLTGAGYSTSYLYTNLGQVWQAPQGTNSTNSQYLYCDSSHPHQLTGLYSLGATCNNKTGQTYTSSYDAWGNVTSRTVNSTSATLSYDGLDHLTKYDAGSAGQEQYIYDASGERVLRRSTSAGSTNMTVYAFGLEEHRYSGSGGNQGNTYYYSLGGLLIGEFDGTNMFLTDALGSVIETISATANSAAVQGNQVYSPYGSSRYQQGSMGTTKGFTGQYNDSLSGLDYYGSRYYDPVVGRFLSADALAGLDPYTYVGGNPETYSDPTGHIPCAGDGVGPCGGSASPPPGDKPRPAVAGAAVVPTDSTSGSNNYNLCPGGQQTTDCVATQLQAITSQAVDVNVPVTGGLGPGGLGPCLYTLGGIGGCGLLPGGGPGIQIKIRFHINSITPVDFCPNPAACAFTEAMAKDLAGGEGAKGKGESTDPGFPQEPGQPVGDSLTPEGSTGGPCSFTPDTAVTTDHGQQAIGTLQIGERVLAYNPKTGKMEQEPILHVWINHDHDLVDLTITTTTKGQHGKAATKTSEVVHTNQKHPFFTMEHGFLPVGQIKPGMHLLRADGLVGVVTGWKVVPGTKVMYNLEVAQDHTFTVGAGQWVVHNSGGECGVDPAQALAKARQELGMPPKGTPGKKYVVAILTADGLEFWGMNGGKPISFDVNAISASHAEIDALDQLVRNRATSGITGGIGEMWVDTEPCPPCNKFGGIRSGVRAAGLDSLNVWFPGGTLTITP